MSDLAPPVFNGTVAQCQDVIISWQVSLRFRFLPHTGRHRVRTGKVQSPANAFLMWPQGGQFPVRVESCTFMTILSLGCRALRLTLLCAPSLSQSIRKTAALTGNRPVSTNDSCTYRTSFSQALDAPQPACPPRPPTRMSSRGRQTCRQVATPGASASISYSICIIEY